jgi:hypothetical protein
MSEIFASPDVLRTLATVAGSAALLALTLLIAKYSTKQVRDLVFYAIQYKPRLIAAVDQPGDPFNVALDKLLDKALPGDWDQRASVFLPAFLNALAAGLDNALAAPPREVAIPVSAPAPVTVQTTMTVGTVEDAPAPEAVVE